MPEDPLPYLKKTYYVRQDLAEWLESEAERQKETEASDVLNPILEEARESMAEAVKYEEMTVTAAALEKNVSWQAIRDAMGNDLIDWRKSGKTYLVIKNPKFEAYQPKKNREKGRF
jgi:hypothetical protein